MRISVRPLAVKCATMKATRTSVHSTRISANPAWWRSSEEIAGSRRISGLQPIRIGHAGYALALQLLRNEPCVDQLATQILGQSPGIALVVDHMRRDQYEQFRPSASVV